MSPCCIPSTALRTADTLGKNLVLARGSLQPAGRGRDKQVISKISSAPPCGPPKPCELLTNFTFLRDVCHLGTVHSRKASWRRRRLRGAGGSLSSPPGYAAASRRSVSSVGSPGTFPFSSLSQGAQSLPTSLCWFSRQQNGGEIVTDPSGLFRGSSEITDVALLCVLSRAIRASTAGACTPGPAPRPYARRPGPPPRP